MADEQGVPARELSDEDLQRQGLRAHATRHWVFMQESYGDQRYRPSPLLRRRAASGKALS